MTFQWTSLPRQHIVGLIVVGGGDLLEFARGAFLSFVLCLPDFAFKCLMAFSAKDSMKTFLNRACT